MKEVRNKYLKPRSVTWWAGVGLIGLGRLIGIDAGYDMGGGRRCRARLDRRYRC